MADADDPTAASYLVSLAAYLGARSDQELADALGVAKSTISSWRQRDKVPVHVRLKYERALGWAASMPDRLDQAFDLASHLRLRDAIRLFLFTYYQEVFDFSRFPTGGYLWWADYRELHLSMIDRVILEELPRAGYSEEVAFHRIRSGIEQGDLLTAEEIASPPESDPRA